MFWLLKKIFSLGVVIALVFFALQFKIGDKSLKDYLVSFYRTSLVQEIVRQGKEIVVGYLRKDVGKDVGSGPAMEQIKDEERKELEKVIEREGQ